jgi:hypothetical protein
MPVCVKLIDPFRQTGATASTVGERAAGFTVTAIVVKVLLHPSTVCETEYVPPASVEVFAMTGL